MLGVCSWKKVVTKHQQPSFSLSWPASLCADICSAITQKFVHRSVQALKKLLWLANIQKRFGPRLIVTLASVGNNCFDSQEICPHVGLSLHTGATAVRMQQFITNCIVLTLRAASHHIFLQRGDTVPAQWYGSETPVGSPGLAGRTCPALKAQQSPRQGLLHAALVLQAGHTDIHHQCHALGLQFVRLSKRVYCFLWCFTAKKSSSSVTRNSLEVCAIAGFAAFKGSSNQQGKNMLLSLTSLPVLVTRS